MWSTPSSPTAALDDIGYLDHRNGFDVALRSGWSAAEHPLVFLPRDAWRELFHWAGYTFNGRRRGRPRSPRLLLRGADEPHRDGWSWTESRRIADWFANRLGHPAPGNV